MPRGAVAHDEDGLGRVILSLGSNQGDRVRHLERGLERLRAHVDLEAVSSIYETQPVGLRDQPWFLNLVCQGTTRLRPRAMLEFIQEVERTEGRKRSLRFGPRTLDIDIIAYDDRVIDDPDLQLPHPRMAERAFVLEPLVEIAPDWRHPRLKRTARELHAEVSGDVVRRYGNPPPLKSAGSI